MPASHLSEKPPGAQHRRADVMPPPASHWLEQAGCGLLACDAQGCVVAASRSALQLLGAAAATIVGRRLSDWCAVPLEAIRLVTPGLHHCWMRDGSGGRRQIGLLVAELAAGGPVRYTVVLQDLAAPAPAPSAVPAEARAAARIDSLTGLHDRSAFRVRLAAAMEHARRTRVALALMFLDLDDFKRVFDSLGHAAGDELLRHVASTLLDTLGGEPVTVARIG